MPAPRSRAWFLLALAIGPACIDLAPPSVTADGGRPPLDGQAAALDLRSLSAALDGAAGSPGTPDSAPDVAAAEISPDGPDPGGTDAAVDASFVPEPDAAPLDLPGNPSPDLPPDQPPDLPPAACLPGQCLRVFLTSSPVAVSGAGGVSTADGVCQSLAIGRGLGGSWRAWLSDATSSPRDRFVAATVPYRLLDGNLVASNFTDLTDGTIAHAIDVYETGTAAPAGIIHEVWTGTLPSGMASNSTCLGWQHRSGVSPFGLVGYSNEQGPRWTNRFAQFCDRTDVHLYCFEQ